MTLFKCKCGAHLPMEFRVIYPHLFTAKHLEWYKVNKSEESAMRDSSEIQVSHAPSADSDSGSNTMQGVAAPESPGCVSAQDAAAVEAPGGPGGEAGTICVACVRPLHHEGHEAPEDQPWACRDCRHNPPVHKGCADRLAMCVWCGSSAFWPSKMTEGLDGDLFG